MRRMVATSVVVWSILAATVGALAQTAGTGDLPPALAPWQGFALHGAAEKLCPPDGNDPTVRICLFPSVLFLDMEGAGVKFSLRARLFDEAAVPLPQGEGVWIEQATEGGKALPVIAGESGPAVWLGPGDHVIEGRLGWAVAPASLRLPQAVGLVHLARQGVALPVTVSPAGELLLTQPSTANPVENTEKIHVFRQIADGTPVTVSTLFRLEVSGLARTISLAGAVPDGTIPLAVRAPVPAGFGPDGSLVLDAGPGRFEVEVVARYPGPVAHIGPAPAPYGREIWSYRAAPQLRETRAEGPLTIDPKTADVPAGWQGLPAFAVIGGQSLTLRELGRGAPVGRDALSLSREMWLDFSGQGLSVRDTITGENRSAWTLSLQPPGELGRVTIDGREQPVVLFGEEGARGVELRSAHLRLVAQSRYPDATAALSAGGFQREFERITTTLRLPPGWQLLAASGPDTVRGGLLSPWSLLDLFLVLVLAVAAFSLRGGGAGLVLGLFFLLSWQVADAPRLVWVFVLAGVGLRRVCTAGSRLAGNRVLRRFAGGVLVMALLVLVVQAIPFAAEQLRQAVAPQLAPVSKRPVGVASPSTASGNAVPAPVPAARRLAREKAAPDKLLTMASPENEGRERLEFDPESAMQTGPAMPTWQFATAALQWKGPVAPEQTMRLYLVPPGVTRLLGLTRVLLLGLAVVLLCRNRRSLPRLGPAVMGVLLVGGLMAGGGHTPAWAGDFPDRALLDLLRERLTEPARCLPHCLGNPFLSVQLEGGKLRITSVVDAATRTAVPLPTVSDTWRPDTVTLDGTPPDGLIRTEGGLKILAEAGHHTVELSGPVPAAVSFTLTPALTPQHVTVSAPGYQVRGLDGRGGLRGALELIRSAADGKEASVSTGADIPAFFEVRRELSFGLLWEVTTTVVRRSPPESTAVASVPLLPGEHPDTAGVTVRDGRAVVPFAAGQERVLWRSQLATQPEMTLQAPEGSGLVETWSLDVAPFYDVTFSGVPTVGQLSPSGRWQPRFAPWPGEKLSLRIRRPPAASGEFLTLERASLFTRQGQAMRDSELSLTFRAAKGLRHAVRLPHGAVVTGLTVAGRETLPTGAAGEVGFALPPGVTDVAIRFREPVGLGFMLRTPAPDLGLPAATVRTNLELPPQRWLLATHADTYLGPAVLYWGWLGLVLVLGLGLSLLPQTPLSRWQWCVYALGLSQARPEGMLLAVVWLVALAWRRRLAPQGAWRFNLFQVLLVLLTLAGLIALYEILDAGLLGLPRMQVAGGGSEATHLVWTWDQVPGPVPVATVFSTPLTVFRGLMLVWAVWLAWSLPRWLRWGFDSLLVGGGWRPWRWSLWGWRRGALEGGDKKR